MIERVEEGAGGIVEMENLFRREHVGIFRMCVAILGNHHDAEEAVQEAFFRVAPRLEALQGDPGAYLNIVARRVCFEMRGRQRSTVPLDDLPHAFPAPSPEEPAVARRHLSAILARLPEIDRRLIFDSYAGYSQEESALRRGLTTAAAAMALSRARKRARALSHQVTSLLYLPRLRVIRERFESRLRAGGSDPYANLFQATAIRWIAGLLLAVGVVASGAQPPAFGPGQAPGAPRGGAPSSATGALSIPPTMPPRTPPSVNGIAHGPAAYGPPRTTPPLSLVGGTINPGGAGKPEDAVIRGFTISPHYASDHTVLASGELYGTCLWNLVNQCAVIFVSHDGGTSWTTLSSSGFRGGQIMLPPAWPDDPAIWAADQTGLKLSSDGGQSFTPVSAASGIDVVDPASREGDDRVVIGSQTLTGYDQASRLTQPYPAILQSANGPDGMVFTPNGTLVAVSELPGQNGNTHQNQVSACSPSLSACRQLMTTDDGGRLTLGQFKVEGGRVLLTVNSAAHIWLADTSVLEFDALSLPAPDGLSAIAVKAASDTMVVALANQADPFDPRVATSRDGGSTWKVHTPPTLMGQGPLITVTYLPDGRLLGAVAGDVAGKEKGIVCSTDDGVTWRRSC